ncbi:MAG: carboxylesterase [Anaerolineaceae bacterium]|nr:MAG: carboxylesterase [Anaerolineaceae bacterium]
MLPFTPFTAPEHQDFLLPGGRPAALLVHGYPGTLYEVRPLADGLNERGWTCRGLLLPGFGFQLETLPQRAWTEWLDAVMDALASLRRDHAPVLLAGHSLGGALALSAAARFPPLDGLVLLAPFWRNRGPLWALLPVLKYLIPRVKPFKMMKTEMDDPRLRKEMQEFLPELDFDDPQTQQTLREFVVPVGMFDELRKAGAAGYRSAPDVTCPTLVIQGADDTTVRLEDTRRLAGRLAGAVTRLEVRAAHELPFAASPSFPEVRESVLAFAETVRRSGL